MSRPSPTGGHHGPRNGEQGGWLAPGVPFPAQELEFHATTGGGPGGQHVNRSATRIALRWNIATSRVLSEAQRTRLLEKLATRLDGDGAIRLVAGEYRSQEQNRRAALERLTQLITRALIVPRPRTPTRPTRGSVERRLESKRQHSQTKRQRRGSPEE